MSEITLSNHAKYRLMERGLSVHDIKKIAKSGKIIKVLEDGQFKMEGLCNNGKKAIVVCKKTNYSRNDIVIITAYYAN